MPDQSQIIKQAVQALANTLAQMAKTELSVVQPFAEKYGPSTVNWGIAYQAAKQANDQDAIAQYEEDFALLVDNATAELSDLGINSEAVSEQAAEGILLTAAHFGAAAIA